MIQLCQSYIEAIEIEADSESIYYPDFCVEGGAKRIPRVLTVLVPVKRYQTLIDIFVPIGGWLYSIFVAPIYYFVRAVKFAKLLGGRQRQNIIKNEEIYLATSSGANLAYIPRDAKLPNLIVTTPFRGDIGEDVLSGVPRVSIVDALRYKSIYKAYALSVFSSWVMLCTRYRRRLLWSYTALEWYLTYFALKEMQPKYIWVSNHHDRWLLLALTIPNAKVIMVQHGRLFHVLEDGRKLTYKRLRKIENVYKIFALDQESEHLFGEYIDTSLVTFNRYQVTLGLVPWRDEDREKVKILVVGGSFNLGFYVKLMNAIRQNISLPIALAIRHHPLQKSRLREIAPDMDVWELKPSDPLPEPDLFVSYGSSIDDQIRSMTHARIVNYTWSNNVDIPDIVNRVRIVAESIERI